jgi:predicted RNA-binding Zn ribbon-like protein
VAVGDPAGEQQPAAERERVGADDPVQPGGSEPEIAPDGRQRDRDDRDVEHHDELGDAEEGEADGLVTSVHDFGGNRATLRVNSCLVVTRSAGNIELWGGDLALDFANTLEGPRDRQADKDHLRSYADLVAWARRAGALPAGARPQAGDLERARELRAAIYDVFSSAKPPRAALRTVLDLYAEAVEAGTLRDGEWVFTGRHPDRPLWPIAVAAVDLLRSDRLARVKQCANCRWLFVDRSRNGSRRWCSMDECGVHVKMRRYRAARRG